jgi:hypothetical protein
MPKRIAIVSILAAIAVCTPAIARADVHIVQDSCDTSGSYPIVYFSIVNPSAPSPVCRMSLVPEDGRCFLLQCGTPDTWSCFPGDVTTFFEAGAAPGACVELGERQSGFQATLLTPLCCFIAVFADAGGNTLGTQQICFDCGTVRAESETWGRVKRLFE